LIFEYKAINTDSVYWIGSVSKKFTAVALLKLAEQRENYLDITLNQYFKGFKEDTLSKSGKFYRKGS